MPGVATTATSLIDSDTTPQSVLAVSSTVSKSVPTIAASLTPAAQYTAAPNVSNSTCHLPTGIFRVL